MKKMLLVLGAVATLSLNPVWAATATGEAAGAQASTTAQGNSNAIGVGAVTALLGVALLTAGGGDKGTSSSTTTATVAGK